MFIVSDIINLAVNMLNIECGTLSFKNVDGKIINLPSKIPTISINCPSVIKNAAPYAVHYKPTVGVIYYISSSKKLERQLTNLMSPYESHLQVTRTCALTSHAEIRRNCNETPLRTFIQSESTSYKDIQYISDTSFTWLILPIDIALHIGNLKEIDCRAFNMTAAGILYGIKPNHSKLELDTYNLSDFGIEHTKFKGTIIIENDQLFISGKSTIVYNWRPPIAEELPTDILVTNTICFICDGPLWGTVYALWKFIDKKNNPILQDTSAAGLCKYCAGSVSLLLQKQYDKMFTYNTNDDSKKYICKILNCSTTTVKRITPGIYSLDTDTLLVCAVPHASEIYKFLCPAIKKYIFVPNLVEL
jgi:hypothetical protein